MNFSFSCVKSSIFASAKVKFHMVGSSIGRTLLLRVLFDELDKFRSDRQRLMVQFLHEQVSDNSFQGSTSHF